MNVVLYGCVVRDVAWGGGKRSFNKIPEYDSLAGDRKWRIARLVISETGKGGKANIPQKRKRQEKSEE